MVVLVIVATVLIAQRIGGDSSNTYSRAAALAFNFRYSDVLRPVARNGAYVRLEARRDGLFLQQFAVLPLRLPSYRGVAAGVLPALATKVAGQLAQRYPGFTVVGETRTFINQVSGYAIVFRARLGSRTLFGRYVMLPRPVVGTRDGVVLLLLTTPASGTFNAESVGSFGATKLPLHSFRFSSSVLEASAERL